jgi:hypothetical protein
MRIALAWPMLAAAVCTASAADAASWSRSGSVTTWRGTYHGSASGSCANGTCARSVSVTGPNGRSVSRTGTVSRVAPHRYDYSLTTTGPNGNSITRSGTVIAHPY